MSGAYLRLVTLVALAALPVAPVLAQDQPADTTFLNRNIRQQMFLLGYLKENKPESPPRSPDEVDLYITRAAEAWAKTVDGEDPLVGQFNPYVFMWLLHMAYSGTGLETPGEADCHVYSEYAVPAFLADFERYREVAPVNAPLIHVPSHNWIGGSLAVNCELHPAQWARLEAAFAGVPSVAQDYIDQAAYADERTADQIRRVQQIFEWNAPLYAIRAAIYRGRLDEAFAGLAAATTQGHGAHFARPLGQSLWRAYAEDGRRHYALATLDLLARTLTAGDLPRDTLRAWYVEVEPERGQERFELMTATVLASLVPSGEPVELIGTYTDLLTGGPVDLATFSGQLVLIDFWATWCSPCIAEIPELRALVAEYGERVTFVSVNADAVTGAEGPDGVRAFMQKHSVDYPVLYDEPAHSLAARFGVEGYPAKFLISHDGVLLVHPSDGRRTVTLAEVEAHIEGIR